MGYIKAQQIPKSEGNMMASLLLSSISNYFADPKHQQEFEEWKRMQDEKAKLTLTKNNVDRELQIK